MAEHRQGADLADPTWFGRRLRELREAAGLSRPELATRAGLGVSETVDGYARAPGVDNLEQGRTAPTWATACALADALGVTVEAFRLMPTLESLERSPGRPRSVEAPEPPQKKPRGRPKKA